jgi:hypothetical protein
MPTALLNVLLKALLAVVTKIIMVVCGEEVIAWLLFKLADEMAASTKTHADDDFVAMIKAGYDESKLRNPLTK